MLFRRKNSPLSQSAPELQNYFTDDELEALSRLGTTLTLQAGSVLTVEGEPGREALVIISGTAAVSRDDEIIATLSGGEIVGEMALLSGQPRSATVVASTDLKVSVLGRREFSSLLQACPNLRQNFEATAATRESAQSV